MGTDERLVRLGEWEVAAEALGQAGGAEKGRDAPAAVLRSLILRPVDIEPVPRSGWIRLLDSRHLVLFGCRDDRWGDGTWVVVAVEGSGDEWRFRSSSYGVEAKHSTGVAAHLRLAWPVAEFVTPTGTDPNISVALINDGTEPWDSDDDGGALAVASLTDLSSGAPFRPSEEVAYALTWPTHVRLDPGERRELPVLLAVEPPQDLPPGSYEVEVTVGPIGLRLDGGRLRVLPG